MIQVLANWNGMTVIASVYEDGCVDVESVQVAGESDDLQDYLTQAAIYEIKQVCIDVADEQQYRHEDFVMRSREHAENLADAARKERRYGIV